MTSTLASLIGPRTIQQGEPYVDQALLDKPPLAPDGLIFLLPAIAQAGRATRKDEWGNWEREARFFLPLPAFNRSANDIVAGQRFRPPPAPPSLASIASGSVSGNYAQELAHYNAEKAQWDADSGKRLEAAKASVEADRQERERIEQGANANADGIDALHAAFSAIARQVVSRKIDLHARLCSGGRCFVIPPDTLADEALPPRVSRQGILTVGSAEAYLFLDREQFERAFPSQDGGVPVSELDRLPLSENMRLALDVIQDWNIGPDNQPTKESIARHVLHLAELKGILLSPKKADEIARVVRENTKV